MEIGEARQGMRALPPSVVNMSGFSAWSDRQIWQDHRTIDNAINPNESGGHDTGRVLSAKRHRSPRAVCSQVCDRIEAIG
jgi:hypothetical protein